MEDQFVNARQVQVGGLVPGGGGVANFGDVLIGHAGMLCQTPGEETS